MHDIHQNEQLTLERSDSGSAPEWALCFHVLGSSRFEGRGGSGQGDGVKAAGSFQRHVRGMTTHSGRCPPQAYTQSVSQLLPGFERITSDPAVLGGKPCIRGLRLSVQRVLELLARNPSWEDLQAGYPGLEAADIHEALAFAATDCM